MQYEEALRLWGATKVAQYNRMELEDLLLHSTRVEFDFNEGFNCCGGSDPNCYCSFAESPSANVVVSANGRDGRTYRWSMDVESFDFATVLRELCELGEGGIFSV